MIGQNYNLNIFMINVTKIVAWNVKKCKNVAHLFPKIIFTNVFNIKYNFFLVLLILIGTDTKMLMLLPLDFCKMLTSLQKMAGKACLNI